MPEPLEGFVPTLSPWRRFWRGLDEARLIVRVMLIAKFSALVAYVFVATRSFHGVIMDAMAGGDDWTELAAILAACTTFYGVTIPVLANMYLKAWTDYRQSGTDWQQIEVDAVALRERREDRAPLETGEP